MSRSIVRKDNNLINSRYELSLNEQKLFLFSLCQIEYNPIKQEENETDEAFNNREYKIFQEMAKTPYKVKVSDIDKSVKMNKSRFLKMGERLRNKGVRINSYDIKKRNEIISVGLIRKLSYNPINNDISVYFDEDVIPYLVQLKNKFTVYNINEILKFYSTYSLRIYEMIVQYKNTSYRKRKFNIEEFYETFNLSKSMRTISKLKKDILAIRMKEINAHSNMKITNIKFYKNGTRKFQEFEIIFTDNWEVLESRKNNNTSAYLEEKLDEVLNTNEHNSNQDYCDYILQSNIERLFLFEYFSIDNKLCKLESYYFKATNKNVNLAGNYNITLSLEDDKNEKLDIDTDTHDLENLYYYLLKHKTEIGEK